MDEGVVETIDALLQAALDDIDDPKQDIKSITNLRDLGYLD